MEVQLITFFALNRLKYFRSAHCLAGKPGSVPKVEIFFFATTSN